MKNQVKLLVVGNVYDPHIIRFIRHLKELDNTVLIDTLSWRINKTKSNPVEHYVRYSYEVGNVNYAISIPGIRGFSKIMKIRKTLKSIPEVYDVINIHYPEYFYSFTVDLLKKKCNKLVIAPWGSDVYRVSPMVRLFLRPLYKSADYVKGSEGRFVEDCVKYFKIDRNKLVNISIGSETIDYINDHIDKVSAQEAKEKIGASGKYVITIGYNAAPEQNHIAVIDSILKIRDDLPRNLLLILPLTYNGNEEYKKIVKSKLDHSGVDYICFDSFLPVEDVFYLRLATDLFIHVQTTDANSASLQEYLLCKKTIINGAWLQYPHYMRNGEFPYYETESFETLSDIIKVAVEKPKYIDEKIIDEIREHGWNSQIRKWVALFKSCAND